MGIPRKAWTVFLNVFTGWIRDAGNREVRGLGLSIVKHIVNFYHGSIHVASQLEKGTEFMVTIQFLKWEIIGHTLDT